MSIDDELKEIPLFLDSAEPINLENLFFNLSRLTQYFLEGDVREAQYKAAYSIHWATKIIKEKLHVHEND